MADVTTVVVVAQNLRLRVQPALDAQVVATMPQGSRVEVLASDHPNWFNVRLQSVGQPVEGWCLRRMLDYAREQPMPDFPAAQDRLWDLANRYANRVGYLLGKKVAGLREKPPTIDCSGWVCFLLQNAMQTQNVAAKETVFHSSDIEVLNTWSDRIILEVEARTPVLLTGPDITAPHLRGGMVIGLSAQHESWEANAERVRGINHIILVVRRLEDGALFVSESRGPSRSGGVRLTPLASWLSDNSQWIFAGRAWAVDPMALADPFTDWVIQARGTAAPQLVVASA